MASFPAKVSGNSKLIGFKSDYVYIRYASAGEVQGYDRMDLGLFGKSWAGIVSWSVLFLPGVTENNWKASLGPANNNFFDTRDSVQVIASGSTNGNYNAVDSSGAHKRAYHGDRTVFRFDNLKSVETRNGGSLVLQIDILDPNETGDIANEFTFDGQVRWSLYSK